jgi:Aspartyl protease
MKHIVFYLATFVSAQLSVAQTSLPFFGGKAKQEGYYSRISYDTTSTKIIVPVSIHGKTYRFILDTGAPTAISTELFDELKPTVIRKLHITDANNAADSLSIVSLSELTLGDVTFTDVRALVAGPNIIFDCFGVDGFIGSNILRHSIIQLNHQTKQLVLTDSKKKLALNKKQGARMFLDNQASPYIWIGVANKKKVKEQVLFDTGMGAMYDLSLRSFNSFEPYQVFIERAKAVGSNSFGFFGAATDTLQYRLLLPHLEINGGVLTNVPVETTVDSNSRIGAELLSYGVATIDYRNQRFYFAPFSKSPSDLTKKEFPISLMPRDGKLFVGFVWDQTLEGKVSRGDQILSIDGQSYEQTDLCTLILNPDTFTNKEQVTVRIRNAGGDVHELLITRK